MFGNNQYPQTITEASNILSNHTFDETYNKIRQTQKLQNVNEENKNEYNNKPISMIFAQIKGQCYCCGKSGHKSPECNSKNSIPTAEWWINKVEFSQRNISNEHDNKTTNTTDSTKSNSNNSLMTPKSKPK